MSEIIFLGDKTIVTDPDGKPASRTITVFPHFDTIVTLPTIHAFQIEAMVEKMRRERLEKGQPPLTREEEEEIRSDAVPGFVDRGALQIRPDPQNMPLAFRAGKLLRKLRSKRQIKYLNVFNEKVRDALRRRGELWRIARLPIARSEMKERILAAKTGIRGRPIYYHNATTGSRLLTCEEFSRLGDLDDGELREHLGEIREFSARLNPQRNPEIVLFAADDSFTAEAFASCDFASCDAAALRTAFDDLKRRFLAAVPPKFREDDRESDDWVHCMFSALVTETDELVPAEMLLSLSPEFFMQIHWLPGGRMVNGELAFDEVFEEDHRDPCEDNARELLYNLVREHEDLEYVNIGRVVNSLSRRSRCRGRREVYIAVVKRYDCREEIVSVIRLQKWGVREHLDEKRELRDAMFRSDEYTEFVLDRRFACRYLGMNIPRRVTARKICERYAAGGEGAEGFMIWSPYFERPYLPGIATDKMPRERFQNPAFALEFARLLGQAAAPNMIMGRCDADRKSVFDDGDEIVEEDEAGMPVAIVVAEQTGSFGDYDSPLEALAPDYAEPVNRRIKDLPDPEAFARAYLDAFVERFSCVQEKYRKRRRAFDTLFRTRPYDEMGCFAFRWKQVLKRLDQADPHALAEIIRAHLRFHVGC